MQESDDLSNDIKLSDDQKAECQRRVDHAKTNITEGEPAIAYGRGAGAAMLLGDNEGAEEIWQTLERIKPGATLIDGMPSLVEFFDGYKRNPEKFAPFSDKANFPLGGEAFSNASGSYARALAHMSERIPAIVEGEPNWAYDWGVKALKAAGLDQAAEIVRGAPETLESKWADSRFAVRPKGIPGLE